MEAKIRYNGDGLAGTELVVNATSQQDVSALKELFNDNRVNEAGQSPVGVFMQKQVENGREVYVARQLFTMPELPPPALIPHADGVTLEESQEGVLSVKAGGIALDRLSPALQNLLNNYVNDPGNSPYDIIFTPSHADSYENYNIKANNLIALTSFFSTMFFRAQANYGDIELNSISVIDSNFLGKTVRSFSAKNATVITGAGVFQNCNIASISIPNVQLITGSSTFQNCNIESISLQNLQSITGPYCFKQSNLSVLSLPKLSILSNIECISYMPNLTRVEVGTLSTYAAVNNGLSCPLLDTIEFCQDVGHFPLSSGKNQITTIIVQQNCKARVVLMSHDWTGLTSLSQASIADLFTKLEDNTGHSVVTFRFAAAIYAEIPQEIKDLATGKNYVISN